MTPQQKKLVRESFDMVIPIADTAAALFYGRLFEIDPMLRHMFKGDMKEQGRKLMTTLRVVVANLDRLDQIVPAVQALGARHATYRVEDRHYDTVAQALLWTLGQGLGEAFTPETEAAWVAAYTLLAGVMKEAAAEARKAQEEGLLEPAVA